MFIYKDLMVSGSVPSLLPSPVACTKRADFCWVIEPKNLLCRRPPNVYEPSPINNIPEEKNLQQNETNTGAEKELLRVCRPPFSWNVGPHCPPVRG